MGESEDVAVARPYVAPCPSQRSSSSRWTRLWRSAPERFPSTKPVLTEHQRAPAVARAHPRDVLAGYLWLMPGLMSSGGLGR